MSSVHVCVVQWVLCERVGDVSVVRVCVHVLFVRVWPIVSDYYVCESCSCVWARVYCACVSIASALRERYESVYVKCCEWVCDYVM